LREKTAQQIYGTNLLLLLLIPQPPPQPDYKERPPSASMRLRKRLPQAKKLPPSDQKTLLRLLDALIRSRKAS
jgi:hypothetical protein